MLPTQKNRRRARNARPQTSLAVIGVLCLVPLLGAAANATTYMSSGGAAACSGTYSTDHFFNWTNGIANFETVVDSVICPIALGSIASTGQSVDNIVMRYLDGSSTNYFWCYPFQTYWDGSTYSGTGKYTCSGGGGCPDYTTSYTGNGYLQWNGSSLPSQLNTVYIDSNFGIICYLPPYQTSYSSVRSYFASGG